MLQVCGVGFLLRRNSQLNRCSACTKSAKPEPLKMTPCFSEETNERFFFSLEKDDFSPQELFLNVSMAENCIFYRQMLLLNVRLVMMFVWCLSLRNSEHFIDIFFIISSRFFFFCSYFNLSYKFFIQFFSLYFL